jgi:hypothetical protein
MLISLLIGQIDGEVAEIPRMLQLSQFILGNSLYVDSFCASEIVTYVTKFLRVLCSRVANVMLRIPVLPR